MTASTATTTTTTNAAAATSATSATAATAASATTTATGGGSATAVAGPTRRAYHHGDLRQAMLAAAAELIEQQGLEQFTLRECARRAGVSHGAPAHHFGDVRGLLTELAALGFEQLQATMDEHEAAAAPEPYAQLVANGQAYVAFALAHRGRFQLMFRSDRVDGRNARLQQVGQATYGRLRRHLAAVIGAAGAGPALQDEKTLLAWVVVHGLSALTLESGLFDGDQQARSATAQAVLTLFMRLLRPGLEAAADPEVPAVSTAGCRPE